MRVNVKGVIIPQEYKRVYDWYDMESTTPKDVADHHQEGRNRKGRRLLTCEV